MSEAMLLLPSGRVVSVIYPVGNVSMAPADPTVWVRGGGGGIARPPSPGGFGIPGISTALDGGGTASGAIYLVFYRGGEIKLSSAPVPHPPGNFWKVSESGQVHRNQCHKVLKIPCCW